jgi:tRNA-dihydrouridine synthase
MRIIRSRLIKGDILRNPHPTSNRVIAAITLMFRTIPKEDTLNRLSSEFGALMRWKKDVTDTSKATKMAKEGGVPKKLIGSAALENSRALAIYEKNSRRNRLSPEVRSKRRRYQESTSSLKNVAMLSLSNTILSMSTRT